MKKLLLICCLLSISAVAWAQKPEDIWQPVDRIAEDHPAADKWIQPQKYRAFKANHGQLRALLNHVGKESPNERKKPDTEIVLPMPDGTFARFNIIESPVMAPELAAKYPEIKTYRGVGIDDPRATLRMDISPAGFHAQIISPHGAVYIDPYWKNDNKLHTSYYKRDYRKPADAWTCSVLGRGTAVPDATAAAAETDIGIQSSGGTLRTYRLANAATVEYTAFHGGTVALGQAAIVTAINRVTGVYEVELAIRLVLVANNDDIVFASGNDGYSNSNGSQMLGQNQTKCDNIIGNGNYDIGHVFSTGGGGVAYLGVVCTTGSKAGGVTGSPSPTGDAFWIDYVAHEMGHQFGADHTFNSTTSNCGGGNRNASTAVEPGSGSTIMAYAGICGADDLQPNSDPYFHSVSYEEIMAYVASGGNCSSTNATGNNVPTVSAGSNFSIPASTPFTLMASGSDPDGDALSYCWEERDLGAAQAVTDADNGASPLFRSFNPTASPSRTFPKIQDILGGTNSIGEKLPTTSRTMKFRVTARDNCANGGGVNSSATNGITIVSSAGPFVVTFPNTSTNLTGPITVTWNVANTTASPINAANVDILLSTNGGLDFTTMLVSNTPNDGSQSVVLPNITTSSARIKLQATGNIFFDISNANFSIAPNIPFPNVIADSATLTVEGCPAANAVIDPNETITVNFALKNVGTADASNVVATLLATNGVTSPSGAQSYGTLVAGGAAVIQPFTLTAAGSCGGSLTATLALQTNSITLGSVSFNFGLGTTIITGAARTNSAAISIPNSGNASPYPSSINVSGVTGAVTKVTVTLRGFDHTFPDDVDVLLVGPTGKPIVLMSDSGGGNAVSGLNLTFDDGAASSLSDAGTLTSGTYLPTNLGSGDSFPSPASTSGLATNLTAYNGLNPNGAWSLYVVDDSNQDTGSIATGWVLNITTTSNSCCVGTVNQPPVIANAFVSPASPDTTQNLLASTFASDPETNPVTFAYQWQESTNNVSFADLAGQTADSLGAVLTVAGDYYRVVVTPNDGLTNGSPFATASVSVPADVDSNGINDDWEVIYFGQIGVDPNADADGDGSANLQEYLASTNPTNASSTLSITSINVDGNDVVVSWLAAFGRSYVVQTNSPNTGEYTNNFADLSPSIVITGIPGTGEVVTNYLDFGGATNSPSHYYRVRILP